MPAPGSHLGGSRTPGATAGTAAKTLIAGCTILAVEAGRRPHPLSRQRRQGDERPPDLRAWLIHSIRARHSGTMNVPDHVGLGCGDNQAELDGIRRARCRFMIRRKRCASARSTIHRAAQWQRAFDRHPARRQPALHTITCEGARSP